MITREPGGVKISEDVREIILDKKNTNMSAKTEALLFASARAQHMDEKVRPALEEGKVVIMDRYIDSSLIYQGYVRGLGIEEVLDLNLFATSHTLPDITFYLDLDPKIGLMRINKDKNREINRLDLEHIDFHQKIRKGYLLLLEQFDRIKLINAENNINRVYEDIMDILIPRLNK